MKKTNQVTGILIVSMLTCTSLVAIIALSPLNKGTYTYKLNTFSSYDDLLAFLHKRYRGDGNGTHGNNERYGIDSPNVLFAKSDSAMAIQGEASGGTVVPDYSTTNVQVQGVDEPDIVKTDGTYLYIVANQKVFIVKAYPAAEATVLSQIAFDNNTTITNIFIRGDRLVVFGEFYDSYQYPLLEGDAKIEISYPSYWWGGTSKTVINIYDVTDRANPILAKEVKIDGGYFDARLIDEYVYVVATEYTYSIYRALDEKNYTLDVPQICIDNDTQNISAGNIYYVDVPELSDTMTHVISINLDTSDVAEKSFMVGSSQTMYVSKNNIFLASAHYPYYPLLYRAVGGSSSSSTEESVILHKISINTGDITYIAQGEVPGRILNQFSMDEYNGFFRIATTIGHASKSVNNLAQNNIYILDESLQQVSEIENIAPGEQIHSARFMGDRAYLVTFKKIDPFFTIDLSDPYHPKILGELKIPGYSDYLHPLDENHILGVGKDTVDPQGYYQDGSESSFAWYQGLKLAVFDVSDFEHPKELWKIVIGDRGTDSPVLYDHKAFLYDATKNLLVLPVSLFEIPEEIKAKSDGYTGSTYGEFTFQGAYVYRLTLENGFEYKGRITHQTSEEMQTKSEYWYWGSSNTDITRTLYIGDVLYTISSSMVKMNGLPDLEELTSLELM